MITLGYAIDVYSSAAEALSPDCTLSLVRYVIQADTLSGCLSPIQRKLRCKGREAGTTDNAVYKVDEGPQVRGSAFSG